MSEWKQNERRTSGFPEGIEEGMVLDVKFRNGDIERRTVGYQEGSDLDWLSTAHFNTNDGYSVDVMAYRVVGETAAAPAIPPKTAIELQAGEVEIPEPVRLVDDAKPDADGWIEWKGGECPVADGTLVDVKYRDGEENIGVPAMAISVAGRSRIDYVWGHIGSNSDITAYRLHQPQEWPEDRMDIVGRNGNDGLHYDDTHLGIKRPDGDGWVKYNAGDVVDLDGVHHVSFYTKEGGFGRLAPVIDKWHPRSNVAWYRLSYSEQPQQDDANHMIDSWKQELMKIKIAEQVATTEPVTAGEFLRSALNTLAQRGKDYDKPEGERSAAAVAVAFNAITGRNLTEAEVWLILQLVKDVRQWQNPGRYHADSALDCVAYAALKAEALASSK